MLLLEISNLQQKGEARKKLTVEKEARRKLTVGYKPRQYDNIGPVSGKKLKLGS